MEKRNYSEDELQEFKGLILDKIEIAKQDYLHYKEAGSNSEGNGTDDTGATFKVLEEGAATLSKEEMRKLAERQLVYIGHLQAALIRIENKTYGICRQTGKLIDKKRLRAVPHATLSIDAKINQC